MFCDLVGSTALSTELDPEDLRRIYRSYRDASVQVVGRYDGHLAQFLGDGVMAYFGWAGEDDEAVYKLYIERLSDYVAWLLVGVAGIAALVGAPLH